MHIKFYSLLFITSLCSAHAETFTIKRPKKTQQIRVIKEQCCEQLIQLMRLSPSLLRHITQEQKRFPVKNDAEQNVLFQLVDSVARVQEISISILEGYWDGEATAFGCCKLFPEFSRFSGELTTIAQQFQKIDSLLGKKPKLVEVKSELACLQNSLNNLEKMIGK